MLEGFNWCLEPDIIDEKVFLWKSKTLFTPYSLLDKIIRDFSHIINCGSLVYNSNLILKIVDKSNYNRYYSYFYNTISKSPQQFKLIITYLDNSNKELYLYCLKNIQPSECIDSYFYWFNSPYNKGMLFRDPEHLEYGCLIMLNKNVLDKHDYNNIKCILDHLLNHYFSYLIPQDKQIKDIPYTKVTSKLKEIALSTGYEITNDVTNKRNFSRHALSKEEFISMLSDTINSIKLYFHSNNKYYDWLKLINHSFILSEQYKLLDLHLRQTIIFCYVNKVLDKYRWDVIKEHIRELLNNPKRSILKDINNKISEIWLKQYVNI